MPPTPIKIRENYFHSQFINKNVFINNMASQPIHPSINDKMQAISSCNKMQTYISTKQSTRQFSYTPILPFPLEPSRYSALASSFVSNQGSQAELLCLQSNISNMITVTSTLSSTSRTQPGIHQKQKNMNRISP